MPAFKVPLRDMRFLLQDVFAANELFASMDATQEVTADLMDAILEEAAKITESLIAPLSQSGDENGCQLINGKVSTPKGFVDAYRAFADAGWVGLIGEPAYGGQGMPKMLSVLFEEMLMGSNPAFGLYPILTSGASLALSLHGTEQLKQLYLPRLYSGQWCASMCLTEPHAGSDLGIIRTKAVPDGNGAYRLTGTKMFITAGDHDLTDNIIHFVLAKLPNAPTGSHGISLFLVPKLQTTDDGILGESNGVTCASLEHKMGLKASATCVLNFDNAKGHLIGEINMGMTCMFTMMNYERLTMGLQGIGLAQNSYDLAVAYARERLQGRAAEGAVAPDKPADPIIVHPDVRRMLLTMRANILAGRALCLYVASKLDIAKYHQSVTEQRRALQLVDLLTPIAKAYCTDRGFEACVLGQQVFGGHGYIREWGLEQNVREARIAQIYEGTNGIQALDLAGRKTVRCRGSLLKVFIDEINEFISTSGRSSLPQEFTKRLQTCMSILQDCTDTLIDTSANDKREVGAAAYSYMELFGLVAYGFMWLRILAAANDKEIRTKHAADYLDSLAKTADFFRLRLMPRADSLAAEIKAGAASLMALKAEQF